MGNPSPQPAEACACSQCREPLREGDDCYVCLLRGGLEEGAEPTPAVASGSNTVAEAPGGLVFGDFEVVRHPDGAPWELGRGAMGVTYRALDRVLHRPVALKVINAAGGSVRERFLREARAAASLRHPNAADIYQFGVQSDAGRCFYAMELVEGETLEQRVRRDGPLPAGAALGIASQVAAALVAAAARGLVHRDLKPSNLMLTAGEGQVKVVDFGLAKAVTPTAGDADLTHGGFVGTPAYASPEQFGQGSVDARSDLYSLGVTLWYALTGRTPFPGRTFDELRDHPARANLPVSSLAARHVPAPVVELLRRVLAVDPDHRPASARELLEALQACRREIDPSLPGGGSAVVPAPTPAARGARRFAGPALVAFVAVLVLAGAAFGAWRRFGNGGARTEPAPAASLEKSIAVLPFKNLGDAENGYFAEGVQDEILTDLSRIADLKVISQTSVMAYVPTHAGNVRDIAQALGVTHLLEGSVQRVAARVRVTAKLIDARTDREVWADRYENDLADIFHIQSEIAERIADNLRAKLSSSEKAAIDARPTADLAAYDLYLRAKEQIATYTQTADWRETLLRAIRLLDDALARDGNFALAHCLAAKAHNDLYFTGLDATPARLALLERAADAALRLQPNLGEAHLARALWLYRGPHDYAEARRELATARAALPNSAEVLLRLAYLDRREGRWDDARRNQERATALDPTNYDVVTEQLVLYDRLRLYREFLTTVDTAAGRLPAYADYFRLLKAEVLLEAGRTDQARAVLAQLPAGYDPNGAATYTRVCAALYDGRPDEAATVAAGFHGEEYPGFNGEMTPRVWLEVFIARARGDAERTRTLLETARTAAAAKVAQHPDDAGALALLGLADAGLGRKEDALREGQRAAELRPVETDAMDGPAVLGTLALIHAWVGEPDAAMGLLTRLKFLPGGPDYGQLRFDPVWGPLRERGDFKSMLAGQEPRL